MPSFPQFFADSKPLLEFHLTDPVTGRDLRRRSGHRGLLATVTLERPSRGKLTELVPDHVFLHEHLDELVAVVNFERVPDEFGDDRARPAPRAERLLGPALRWPRDLLKQLLSDERTFFCASAHVCSVGSRQ